MVQVVQAGNIATFDYLLYPEQNFMNQTYLENQLNNFSNQISDFGRKFLEETKTIYNKINDSSVIRAAKAAIRSVKGIFHPNSIVALVTLDEIRSAQSAMQRYIMAEPTIRETFHLQRCNGFSDTYVDNYPGQVGEQHYDYRRVMDGIVRDVETEEGYDWVATRYFEELVEGDRELTLNEQVSIMTSWDIAKAFLQAGEDPTDMFGGSL